MRSLSITEARAQLPDILTRVTEGEEVTITRHGRPVAVIVRPESLRVRRTSPAMELADKLHDALAAARSQPLSAEAVMTPERAAELIAAIHADRGPRPT